MKYKIIYNFGGSKKKESFKAQTKLFEKMNHLTLSESNKYEFTVQNQQY